ncbi:MAG: hypothetical protein KAW12_10555 [Candidatus Aminicenantes bacterium]|nr:hypothetical protein [Candidatus Aminicenantes bacterium]
MINIESVNQIKQSPIAERIQVIEILLHSLKNDIQKRQVEKKPAVRPFKVRRFSLGEEVHVDREELYSERGH